MYVSLYFIWISTACYVTTVTVRGKGYTDVVVTISSDLNEQHGNELIVTFKELLTSASDKLFVATRRGVYFQEIKIIIPPSWNASALPGINVENVTSEFFERPVIHMSSEFNKIEIKTQQSGGCGIQGDHIDITARFLTNSKNNQNSSSRLFVRNWAKYRYGVFDEVPISDSKYFSDTEICRLTGCYDTQPTLPHNLQTEVDGVVHCDNEQSINITEAFSQSKPRSSLLFINELETVQLFCDSQHISEAPTIHNMFCKERSVWDVIKMSPDFAAMKKKCPVESTVPVFKYYQEQRLRYVFVVQNVFSNESNVKTIADSIEKSLQMFVERLLPDGTEIGVVTFTHAGSEIIVPITKLTDDENERINLLQRKTLVQRDSNTSTVPICAICGLEKAAEMLRSSERADTIILIAESSTFLYLPWNVVKERIRARLGTIVITSSQKKAHLPQFPTANVVFAPVYSSNNSVAIWWNFVMAIISILTSYEGNIDKMSVVHQNIFSKTTAIKGTFFTKVEKVGNDNQLVILSCIDSPDTESWAFSINGQGIKPFHSYKCAVHSSVLNSQDEANWNYEAEAKGSLIQKFAIIALVLQESWGFGVKSWMSKTNSKAPIIYGELKVNNLVAQNAKMMATIFDVDGEMKLQTQLLDSGSGDPDIFKDDGVFSRHVNIGGLSHGSYSVYVTAEIATTAIGENKTLVTSSGYLNVNEDTLDATPCRITDFRVEKIDHEKHECIITFTAPCLNWQNTTAPFYKMKYSRERDSFFVNPDLHQSEHSLMSTPQEEGELERILVQLPPGEKTLHAAIQAAQGDDTLGELSNIVQIHFKTKTIQTPPPTNETTDFTKATTETTASTNKTGTETNSREDTKNLIIIASSVMGAFVFLVLVFNTAACFYCYKTKRFRYGRRPKTNLALQQSFRKSDVEIINHNSRENFHEGVCNSGMDENDDFNDSGTVEAYNNNSIPHHLANRRMVKKSPTNGSGESTTYCGNNCLIHGSSGANTTTQDREQTYSTQNKSRNVTPSSDSDLYYPRPQELSLNSRNGTYSRNMDSTTRQEPLYAQSNKHKNAHSINSNTVTQDLGVV